MAAKIIDPAIGASTWAFGSHRWTPYKGILIINAIMHASHKMLLDHEESTECVVRDRSKKFSVPIEFWIEIRATRRGIEPTSV